MTVDELARVLRRHGFRNTGSPGPWHRGIVHSSRHFVATIINGELSIDQARPTTRPVNGSTDLAHHDFDSLDLWVHNLLHT